MTAPTDATTTGGSAQVAAWPVTDVVPALVDFHAAGVFGPAELHGAAVLSRITGDDRPEVLLAAALALRAPQHGHVCVDLHDVPATVVAAAEVADDVEALAWPDRDEWVELLADSPLVRVRPEGTPADPDPARDRPLVLVGSRLYLDRHWRYERRVGAVLRAKAGRVDGEVDPARVREVLDRVLPAGEHRPDRQRLALATAARRQLTVVAGGPGTGKTHTIARLLALLAELSEAGQVAVVAPTGKAADRLTAAIRAAAADPALDTTPAVRERLRELEGSTIHRLLGWRPGRATRFRHDRNDRLPHRVVVVDETSMVDLPLMSKLLEAIDPACKLVLVGDPDQLASIEAGAVLADVVGPSGDGLRMTAEHRDALVAATGEPLDGDEVTIVDGDGIDDAVVVLRGRHRFGAESGIARLAAAIHAGDGDAATALLRAGAEDVTWLETPGEAVDRAELDPVRVPVVAAAHAVRAAARAGAAAAALHALDEVRVLAAHRRGLVGVTGWVRLVEQWVEGDDARLVGWARPRFRVGQAVMVTQNDRRMRLFNGDVGVVVRHGDDVAVAFHGRDDVRLFAPSRLQHLAPVDAMTIHKSQGSQFRHVVVVLPDPTSRILTRELLYTAVTRASRQLTIVGEEESLRAAIDRRVARASGLRSTLWP